MRTAVLLGAGASVDAGLPLTSEFAVQLLQAIRADLGATSPEAQTLNFVYGAMVNSRGEQGQDPLAAVNVETMISAIRLLRRRRQHEASPFVTGWKPGVSGFRDTRADETIQATALQNAVDQMLGARFPGGDLLRRAVLQVAQSASGHSDNDAVYDRLERALLVRVRRMLLSPTRSVDYLNPIIELAQTQPGGADVATLNYDRTVEIAASDSGIPINTGVERWRPGHAISFPARDATLNLIKVHGSIDWLRERPPSARGVRELPQTRIVRTDRFSENDVPAIVIGDREKLATDGPILDLLHAFAEALRRADHLLVIGYSFADAHVNRTIRDWLTVATRTLTVLDPYWPELPGGVVCENEDGIVFSGDFRHQLTWHLGLAIPGNEPNPPRMKVIRSSATAGLSEAIRIRPSSEPVPRFAVQRERSDDDSIVVSVRNLGTDLSDVAISANRLSRIDPGTADELILEDAAATPNPWHKWEMQIPRLDHDQSITAVLRFAAPPDTRRVIVTVSGRETLNSTFETWEGTVGALDAPLTWRDPTLPG